MAMLFTGKAPRARCCDAVTSLGVPINYLDGQGKCHLRGVVVCVRCAKASIAWVLENFFRKANREECARSKFRSLPLMGAKNEMIERIANVNSSVGSDAYTMRPIQTDFVAAFTLVGPVGTCARDR